MVLFLFFVGGEGSKAVFFGLRKFEQSILYRARGSTIESERKREKFCLLRVYYVSPQQVNCRRGLFFSQERLLFFPVSFIEGGMCTVRV